MFHLLGASTPCVCELIASPLTYQAGVVFCLLQVRKPKLREVASFSLRSWSLLIAGWGMHTQIRGSPEPLILIASHPLPSGHFHFSPPTPERKRQCLHLLQHHFSKGRVLSLWGNGRLKTQWLDFAMIL